MTEEFWQKCVAKHAELVDKHHGEARNRKLVRDEWEQWVTANMPTETVEKLKEAQRENLWQKIERATKANNSYIEPLTEGQLPIFDIPDILSLPIVAGKNRRVLIGRQTKDDADAILTEAQMNADHVNAKLARTRAAHGVEVLWIETHGTISKAHEAGDVPGLEAADDEQDES